MMSGQNISGSDYANLTGRTILPNAAGRFLRTYGTETVALGSTQEDAFQGHEHNIAGTPNTEAYMAGTVATSRSTTAITTKSGFSAPRYADETRPKNLVVSTFIKINKQCNFN